MSIWAEIKKAVNSTVGTQNFKPLDELYRDSRYVYACDHGLLAYSGNVNDKYTYFYVKINIPGTYRVTAGYTRRYTSECKVELRVDKKVGETYTGPVANILQKTSGPVTPETLSVDFSAQKGDIFKITSHGGDDYNANMQSLKLCGMIGTGGAPAEVYTE